MLYRDNSLVHFFDDLSARKSSPGGGSVVAVCACSSLSLLLMVARFSLGKKCLDKWVDSIELLIQNTEQLRQALMVKIDTDVIIFKSVCQAYSSNNSQSICESLEASALFCYSVLEDAHRILQWISCLVPMANINLDSDLRIAAQLAEVSVKCAAVNVRINLKELTESNFNKSLEKKIKDQEESVEKIANQIQRQLDERKHNKD